MGWGPHPVKRNAKDLKGCWAPDNRPQLLGRNVSVIPGKMYTHWASQISPTGRPKTWWHLLHPKWGCLKCQQPNDQLVGGVNPSEKYEFVSWDDYSQYMESQKKKNVLTCSKAPISQWSTFIDHQMVDSNPLCFMVPPKHRTSADLFFSLVAPSKSLLEFTSLHSPLCWSKFRKWSIAIAIAIHR